MTKLNRLVVIAALGLALAGCKDNQKPTGGTADGEILPGSASDAMLPMDSVRSQAPLAPHADKSKAGASDAVKSTDPKPPSDSAAPPEPAPEAAPDATEPGE